MTAECAMAGVTEEKKKKEEVRKVITLITWSDLYLMRPTTERLARRGVSRPRSPAGGCRDDIEDKDAVV